MEEVLIIISVKDEAEKVSKKKKDTEQRLRRMAKTYIDGLLDDAEYQRRRRMMELELELLVVPKVQATEEAGKLTQNLPHLWSLANEEEKRKLLLTILDAVYIDSQYNRVVAIKPKPPFIPVLQVAASREGSETSTVNEPYKGSSLFLVETGESWNQRNPTIQSLIQQRRALAVSFE